MHISAVLPTALASGADWIQEKLVTYVVPKNTLADSRSLPASVGWPLLAD